MNSLRNGSNKVICTLFDPYYMDHIAGSVEDLRSKRTILGHGSAKGDGPKGKNWSILEAWTGLF